MAQVELNTTAPDFTLNNYHGEPVTLSKLNKDHNILLVFNRGFL